MDVVYLEDFDNFDVVENNSQGSGRFDLEFSEDAYKSMLDDLPQKKTQEKNREKPVKVVHKRENIDRMISDFSKVSDVELDSNLDGMLDDDEGANYVNITPEQLGLVSKKIKLRFCEFRISNTQKMMLATESQAISADGVSFISPGYFPSGSLMRVWVEMPDYWARKAKHVMYKFTEAPSYFQVLARVIKCNDITKRTPKYEIVCHIVNLDPVDEIILKEYIGIGVSLK